MGFEEARQPAHQRSRCLFWTLTAHDWNMKAASGKVVYARTHPRSSPPALVGEYMPGVLVRRAVGLIRWMHVKTFCLAAALEPGVDTRPSAEAGVPGLAEAVKQTLLQSGRGRA